MSTFIHIAAETGVEPRQKLPEPVVGLEVLGGVRGFLQVSHELVEFIQAEVEAR